MGRSSAARRQKHSVWRPSGVHVIVRCYCSVEYGEGSGCSAVLSQTHHCGCCGSVEQSNGIKRCATPACTVVLQNTCRHQFSGGDLHVSAQFSDADHTISGSFFFESHDCLPNLAAGDTCQLVGVEMQEWNGCVQLSGKNVSIFYAARV